MINIIDKHDCCGCEACMQACPKRCISLERDKEGFLYPIVNTNICVECGVCERVCPVINTGEQTFPLQVWAARNEDEEIRRQSSSGGIATKIAEKIIDEGGVVFGVIMTEQCEAIHTFTETKAGLEAFRGSKYIQSRVGESFKQAKEFLKAGRKVLFIGTPCQISGLKYFLRKDYSTLYTVDFICHGVPSPGVFKWYIQEEVNKYVSARKGRNNSVSFSPIHSIPKGDIQLPEGLKVVDIHFRDKREGWKKYSFVLQLAEASADGKKNTVSFSSNVSENIFLKGFCSDLYLRPSCHKCPVRSYRSGSDLTIADFWGQEYMFPEFDNDTGTSCVIVKTTKGQTLFSSVKHIKKEIKALEQVLSFNPSLIESKPEGMQRRKFWRNVGKYSFSETCQVAMKLTIFERVMAKIKRVLS